MAPRLGHLLVPTLPPPLDVAALARRPRSNSNRLPPKQDRYTIMASRQIFFHARDLLDLLIAYNDGRNLPLYAEVKQVAVSAMMPRLLCLVVEAREWAADAGDVSPATGELLPLLYHYEGRHNMVFTPNKGQALDWKETPQQ